MQPDLVSFFIFLMLVTDISDLGTSDVQANFLMAPYSHLCIVLSYAPGGSPPEHRDPDQQTTKAISGLRLWWGHHWSPGWFPKCLFLLSTNTKRFLYTQPSICIFSRNHKCKHNFCFQEALLFLQQVPEKKIMVLRKGLFLLLSRMMWNNAFQ